MEHQLKTCSNCVHGIKNLHEEPCSSCWHHIGRPQFTSKLDVGEEVFESDMVNHPSHYKALGMEVKDIIKMILESDEYSDLTPWEAYCLGNELKYRLRAGFKDDPDQDIKKAMKYFEFRSEG